MRLLALMAVVIMTAAPLPLLAAPGEPDPADAAALRECVAGKGAPKAQHAACFTLIVKRCFAAIGNDYDSTVRDCHRREEAAWDVILNEEYRAPGGKLGDAQKTSLRNQQRAWIRSKDKKCNVIYDEFQGTMAYPFMAQCFNRETSQRALYLMNYPARAPH
jgi:uncharacterized protein YecT (DUF1311 family)